MIDFTNFANNLEVTKDGTSRNEKFTRTPADKEGEKIFNLLMPYAVSEKTSYSHVSVSYLESSAIPGYDLAYAFTIECYNEITNKYEQKGFTVKSYRKDGLTIEESCEKALIDGDYEFTELGNTQILSGDIIFSLDNDDIAYYEISPTAQQ